jgi:hypothetical protein
MEIRAAFFYDRNTVCNVNTTVKTSCKDNGQVIDTTSRRDFFKQVIGLDAQLV